MSTLWLRKRLGIMKLIWTRALLGQSSTLENPMSLVSQVFVIAVALATSSQIWAVDRKPARSSDMQQSENAVMPDDIEHEHRPIIVPSRPIVARYKVALLQPRRILLAPNGDLYIADWGAGTVIRISPDERVSLVVENLEQPAGLALDNEQRLYVAVHNGGMMDAGVVIRIAPDGRQSVYAENLTGPTSLAFDQTGRLYVANLEGGNVCAVPLGGGEPMIVAEISHPGAVFVTPMNEVLVASFTQGVLYRLVPNESPQVVVDGLKAPSDITRTPQGHVIVTNSSGTQLTYVDLMENVSRPFALVPKGTVSTAFDQSGNLIIANWELRVVTKITTHLTVPCPHCNKPIPLKLEPLRRPNSEGRSTGPLL